MPPRRHSSTTPDAARFRARLLAWFDAGRRDLPWRRTSDPYRVWVSEVMLQQTQVDRVVGYYERFLEAFPTVQALADAPIGEVLRRWEGLGYYARAENLHRLARRLTADGGDPARALPSDPAELRALPGIGPYTAGAVASFAYERRAALVDTNVARVLRRVFAPSADPKSSRGRRILWELADRLLPRTGRAAWTHNQALMELGALVCTARAPRCGGRPVRSGCKSVATVGKAATFRRRGVRATALPGTATATATTHRG